MIRRFKIGWVWVCILFNAFVGISQYHDNIWLIGYDYSDDSTNGYGITALNFNTFPRRMCFFDSLNYGFYLSSTIFSNVSGENQFFTNGLTIRDKNNSILSGSDSFNAFYNHDLWYKIGLPAGQGIIALPGTDNMTTLIHAKIDFGIINGVSTGFCHGIAYSTVDMTENNGLGQMVVKDMRLVEDTIAQAGIFSACRHANGRDWWVITPKLESNEYYRMLVFNDTPRIQENQVIGMPINNGPAQSTFSPDGHGMPEIQFLTLKMIAWISIDSIGQPDSFLTISGSTTMVIRGGEVVSAFLPIINSCM